MTTVRTRPMSTTRDRILLLLATNSLLPSRLTARELGKREDVKQKGLRISDLLLAGLRPRRTAPNPREKSS